MKMQHSLRRSIIKRGMQTFIQQLSPHMTRISKGFRVWITCLTPHWDTYLRAAGSSRTNELSRPSANITWKPHQDLYILGYLVIRHHKDFIFLLTWQFIVDGSSAVQSFNRSKASRRKKHAAHSLLWSTRRCTLNQKDFPRHDRMHSTFTLLSAAFMHKTPNFDSELSSSGMQDHSALTSAHHRQLM